MLYFAQTSTGIHRKNAIPVARNLFFEVKMSRIGSRTAVIQEMPPEGGEFHFPVLSASMKSKAHLICGAQSPVFRRERLVFFWKRTDHLKKTENACLQTGKEHPFATRRSARPADTIHPASGFCLHSAGTRDARDATTTANPT